MSKKQDNDTAELKEEMSEAEAAAEAVEEKAEEAKSEVEQLREEVQSLKNEALRAHAEAENTRKRLHKQKQEDVKYAALPLMRELLTVTDNLELALKHAPEGDPLREGVGMALDGMKKILSQHGMQEINAEGQEFDPTMHEALTVMHNPDMGDNVVVEQHRPGYRLHDRVVRASQVVVNRHPEESGEKPSGSINVKA